MDCVVVVVDGPVRAYEASSAQGVVVDICSDWRSFGDIAHTAVFAFAASTASDGALCYRSATMVLVVVGDLSAMADGERQAGI